MSKTFMYEFPLTEKLAKYDDQALIALVEKVTGVRPIAIVKHFKHRRLRVFFDRELGYSELKRLEETLTNPPKLYVAVVRRETEEEIRRRVAEKVGVEPLRVIVSGDDITGLVFDRPVDISKLTDDDFKVRKRVFIKTSVED